ncbi:MAG: hypothetical protein JW754_05800 [Candidatus Aenigmarchaeota archaeon]|nr:hypothetical protein [Candidatus Aenigmarchaeota archaeon]
MGFLDFLKKREEELQPLPPVDEKPVKIEIGRLRDEVMGMITDDLESEKKRSRELHAGITENFSRIKELNNFLEAKSFEKHDRTYTNINMIKNNYVKKSYSLLGTVPRVQSVDYETMKDFEQKTRKIVSDLKNINPKQAFLLSRYFKHETGQIISSLKSIDESLEEINRILDSNGRRMWIEKVVTDDVNDIISKRERLAELEKSEKELEKKQEQLEKRLENEKSGLKEFMKGGIYKRIMAIEDKIKEANDQKDDVEADIRSKLSEIKRPLKKIEYYMKSEGYSKSEISDFDRLLHSPTKTFLADGGEDILRSVLGKIKDLYEKGKVELKGSDRDHVVDLCQKSDHGVFSRLKQKYTDISEELDSMVREREDSRANEEKEKMERDIGGIEKDVSDTENEIERIRESIDTETEEIGNKTKELEALLKENVRKNIDIGF